MKLIIIEGCDRTGKDTVCKHLTEMADSYSYRHWGFPIGESNIEKIKYQQHSFKKEFDMYHAVKNDPYFARTNDMVIWNRSHLGEVVYGTLYRDYDPESWVYNLEALYAFDQNPEIYLILLEGDAEFIVKNDDGESFSNNLIQKKTEIALFNKAFDKSIIQNKIKVKVNEGNEYRNRTDIREEVTSFVLHKHQVQGANTGD
jgi:thymidylate kinase